MLGMNKPLTSHNLCWKIYLKYLIALIQRHSFFQIFNVSGRRANYNVVVIANMLANLEMNTMYLFNQLSRQLIYSIGTTHGWIEHNLSLDHYFSPRVSSKKLQCEAALKGNIIVYAEDCHTQATELHAELQCPIAWEK